MVRALLAVTVCTLCALPADSCPRRCRWGIRTGVAWPPASHGAWGARPVPPPPGENAVFLGTWFTPGKAFYQVMTTHIAQDMKVQQMDVKQTQMQHFVTRWVPKKRDAEGRWTFGLQVLACQFDIDIGGNKLTYDSADKQAPRTPLTDYFTLLLTTEFPVVMEPDFTIRAVDLEDFWRQNGVRDVMTKSAFSEATISGLATAIFRMLPNRAVHSGQSWNRKRSVPLEGFGTFDSDESFGYEGVDHHILDRIAIMSKMKHVPGMAKTGQGLPFKILKSDLKSTSGGGTLWFDRGAGRIVKGELSFKLEGTVLIDIGGFTTSVELLQEQKTTLQTTDRDPREKYSPSSRS